ncbi:MAG: hypothetical protein ABIJ57_13125 [Pseudomonadota bacterium]
MGTVILAGVGAVVLAGIALKVIVLAVRYLLKVWREMSDADAYPYHDYAESKALEGAFTSSAYDDVMNMRAAPGYAYNQDGELVRDEDDNSRSDNPY